MQAVIYARSSGTPEFDQRSIRAQVTSAQRYAETNGLIVQRVFIDKGTGRQRPILAQAVDQVSSGEAEIGQIHQSRFPKDNAGLHHLFHDGAGH